MKNNCSLQKRKEEKKLRVLNSLIQIPLEKEKSTSDHNNTILNIGTILDI